ncbi:MAG TPA: gephyrin-like molybdotransferase Glp, partial [Myxococcaceae bacterium]|nr:gephyrin-like molybdotransferase Glp [Myxococcaceae bacterium]
MERILAAAAPLPAEATPIADTVGRAMADDLIAQRTVPPWDNSAMDGYAVRSADVAKAPVRLRVIETIYAGQLPTRALAPGECSQIMTGAPMPRGADAVVMQERTERRSETEVEILEAVGAQSFVRARGEDVREGETLLPKGSAIGVAEAALLWSQGFTEVNVPRRPRVAILATGDELSTAETAASGKIIDSGSPALALAAARCGAIATRLGIAQDSAESLARALSTAASGFDAVLTIGGVSGGAHDFVRAALAEAGVTMDFWKVAIKPGKPLAFGRRGATLFFGLPGNPTSSLVSFELFVRPALRRMLGHAQVLTPRMEGRTEVEIRKPAGLTHFIRAHAHWRDG